MYDFHSNSMKTGAISSPKFTGEKIKTKITHWN